MSRRAFGQWGWDLDEWDYAAAMAALGVVVPLLQERNELRWGGPPARSRGPSGRARLEGKSAHYHLLLEEASGLAGPLVWDVAPLGRHPGLRTWLLARLPAGALARAWSETRPGDWQDLEVHPVRWLQTAWILETISAAVRGRTPYVPLPERDGRLRWTWPVRVGFLQPWLRHFLYERLPDYLANLTQPELDPGRCDLLLAADVPKAVEIVDGSPAPEAAFVIVLDDSRPARGLDGVAHLAARVHGKGAAVVRAPDWQVWYRAFIRELSHARRLTECLAVVGGVGAVFATPSLVRISPLALAASALAGRMVQAPVGEVALTLPPRTEEVFRIEGRPLSVEEVGRRLLEEDLLSFASENDGATHVTNVDLAVRPVLEEAERNQASQRFIRAQVLDPAREGRPPLQRGFHAGVTHDVVVSIGPRDQSWLAGDQPFPDEQLPPAPSGHRLTVVLAEPDLLRTPLVGTIELPPFGASDAVVFKLPVRRRTSAVEARITVLHRGRILQTAVLRGEVFSAQELDRLEEADEGPRIRILIEAVLRPGMVDLDQRRRFQAALVLNHNRAGEQSATLIRGRKAAVVRLDAAAAAVKEIGKTFELAERDNAFGRKLGSKKSLKYLRRLALHGRTLYLRVGQRIEAAFPADRPLDRIQVLSADPDTFLPVEVIYDQPPPAAAPKLCRNWAAALTKGRCDPAKFHREDEEGHLDVVCPAGFWGISKVIEREAVDPSQLAEDPQTRGIDFAVFSSPVGEVTTLGGFAPVLFAASEHLNDVESTELERVTTSLKKLADGNLLSVETWKDWARQVKAIEPPLLLLLSHTELNTPEGAALEIAKKAALERRVAAEITKNHVTLNPDRPGPIVMLLGCTTAVPQNDFQSFVVQFKQMGASLVVGTIAPVLGRHAGRAAEALIERLLAIAAGARNPDRGMAFGDAMLALRRELLAEGVLISLCLATYGDTDWRIPTRG